VVPDGTVQTYRIPVDVDNWVDWDEWEGPWKQLGVWFDARERLGSLDILSVTLVPKPAAHRVSESTDERCLGLKNMNPEDLPNPTTVITWASVEAAQSEGWRNFAPLPEHCRIQGKINERVGVNDQPYAINFRMRLPTEWNGRFFFQGSGGTNGGLDEAVGTLYFAHRDAPLTTALHLGYAVVSQDSGHDNGINDDDILNGEHTFGFDPQARIDYGYNSLDEVTQAAKALIETYYEKPPDRSYYWGASNGGREALVMSQRFPTYFDGIVAVYPGINWPQAIALQEAWDVQAFAEVARADGLYDEFGQPFVNKTFTDDDLVLVSNAVLERCDTLDGLADGINDNFPACTTELVGPRLAELTCNGSKEPDCLSEPQVTALLKVYGGPKNSQGEPLYADWPWDAGIGGKVGDRYFQTWRDGRIGGFNSTRNSSARIHWASASAAVWTTPPTPVAVPGPDRMAYLLNFDFDTDTPKIFATTDMYTESGVDFMMATSTDLSAFKNRGGKLIVVSGVSDHYFSINDLTQWWDEVNRINDGTASDFVRLFAVPGMSHGRDNPATDEFDANSAIVNWVENGSPPDRLVATARGITAWPGRTRPLCPWPQQARYKGSGSIEDASNFVCVDVVRN
jgi:feruloyl esterase